MTKRLTLKSVNKAIKSLGGKETLVKGAGYFYFVSVGPGNTPSSGGVCLQVESVEP